ncbi:hypothetical protein MKEN_01295100 [Mycena kentingensis (nom. inval.)]|nr:hypothetical protein MKEN_01295100 [Mycena kentingensis (nom. inval.)]
MANLLIIDSYDSFTYNLASLCKQAIPGCSIFIVKNDTLTIDRLLPYLSNFHAIVVGPGPGSPENDTDIGVIKYLWDLDRIPILGVCLGLQSLGLANGAKVKRLEVVKHGQIYSVQHCGRDLFQGVGSVEAVRYHSLHIALQACQGAQLEELAWTDDENGRVVMAVRHQSKPLWAVQYHPESVRTRGGGLEVVQNFWRLARNWNSKMGRTVQRSALPSAFDGPWPVLPPLSSRGSNGTETRSRQTLQTLHAPHLSAIAVCELFGVDEREDSPFVLLDSAAKPGRYSIVGSLMPTSLRIVYYVPDDYVMVVRGQCTEQVKLKTDIWSWMAELMAANRVKTVHPDIPFAGGLVGSLSYELGVRELGVGLLHREGRSYPDVNMVFVERSVVLDSLTGQVYVQSLLENDPWVADTVQALENISTHYPKFNGSIETLGVTAQLPDKTQYISRINAAKEYISAGDSYELCLTARTTITVPKPDVISGSPSWRRYKSLRSKNPAPYSAFLRLHPTVLLSSSPERFLSTSQPPNPVFQLRPIKGTVRKAPGITRAVAEELLAGSVKEVAENLMIVDLIRHDLHAVVGEDVQVKQFCTVEEYETVWQLVSVIEGRLDRESAQAGDPDSQVGWEMLRRCLPPGSMTGAPKKRSVELLQTLEDGERNLYSGVFGYWSVGGQADWSVCIRSCFKLNDDSGTESGMETWHIGAGGAITALSDVEAEWDEMLAKLQSAIGAFGVSA